MLDRLKSALSAYDPDDTYLVAVSGGMDSISLLHGLTQLGYHHLVVCHANHQLRGQESAEDADFVAELAERYHLSLDSVEMEVAAYAKAHSMSLETAGRALRYEYFDLCADEHGTQRMFLAHHADDQAETVLLNALRGAGLTGLAGMRMRHTLESGLTLIRPLLDVPRSEIETYARAHKLKWRTDSSNASRDFTRNRIRLEALPLLNDIMRRDVAPQLAQLARLSREDDDLLTQLTTKAEEGGVAVANGLISVPDLAKQPAPIQRRLILRWLRAHEVPEVGLKEVSTVLGLLKTAKLARVNLPGGLQVRRKARTLTIAKQ
jgi:tRNA(Ile)-lysidine synthase